MIQLPISYAEEFVPFFIPPEYKKVGIIGDIHLPYHSYEANQVTIEFMVKNKVDAIILNGDIIDFYGLSRYEKDPRMRSVKEELDATKEYLDALIKHTKARLFWKNGNHDERFERWMMAKAPELLGIKAVELDSLLDLGTKGIDYITGKRAIKLGGLNVFHGHELNIKSATVSPARTLYLKAKVSSVMGHLHNPSHHSAVRADGHIIGCWSIGHLGDPHPRYAPYNEWQHGFAIVDRDDKEFEFNNFKIMKGKVYRT
jgi:predicted phosphodiesterase